MQISDNVYVPSIKPFVSDIAIFVLKRDVKLQLTNSIKPCVIEVRRIDRVK